MRRAKTSAASTTTFLVHCLGRRARRIASGSGRRRADGGGAAGGRVSVALAIAPRTCAQAHPRGAAPPPPPDPCHLPCYSIGRHADTGRVILISASSGGESLAWECG